MPIRVLFLYPNHLGNYMVPPAIGILSAVLKRDGHIVDIFDTTNYEGFGSKIGNVDRSKVDRLMAKEFDDFNNRLVTIRTDPYDDFYKKINEFSPDLIAVSCTEDTYLAGLSLLDKIKDRNIKTIMGGVFPTFAPEMVINNPLIDIVCVGEGEYALSKLAQSLSTGLSYSNIKNLWVKENGQITRNPIEIVDMDNNPLIDINIFGDSRHYRPMAGQVYRMFPVEIFRGCPYKCTYCNSPNQSELYKAESGQKFLRRKSFDNLKKEMLFYKNEMKAEYLYFWSDTFFSWSSSEFDEFCELYADINLPFWIQTRPETVSESRFKKLANIGCHRVSFGIEHGNAEFRKKYLARSVSNEKIIKSLKIVNHVGIPYSVNNIIGFPYETRELAFDTIRLNLEIDADDRNAYPFTPFHGTPLRKVCDDLDFTKPDQLVQSLVADGSVLDMPQFRKKEVSGLCKTFNLYLNLPENMWTEIRKAEEDTEAGNKKFRELASLVKQL